MTMKICWADIAARVPDLMGLGYHGGTWFALPLQCRKLGCWVGSEAVLLQANEIAGDVTPWDGFVAPRPKAYQDSYLRVRDDGAIVEWILDHGSKMPIRLTLVPATPPQTSPSAEEAAPIPNATVCRQKIDAFWAREIETRVSSIVNRMLVNAETGVSQGSFEFAESQRVCDDIAEAVRKQGFMVAVKPNDNHDGGLLVVTVPPVVEVK